MKCPICKKELIVIEREEVELDWCPSCKGFWFDYNEWNILNEKIYLTDKKLIPNIYSFPEISINERVRFCPVCRSRMEKFRAWGTILDRCPKKHGVWFDKGEMSKLLNAPHNLTGDKNPINFLGELFFK